MPEMQAVFYRKADGSEPVDAFIDGLPLEHQVAIDGQIELLNMQRRFADFRERMDADPRVPPRAAGHDAP